jgi:hypothetical protein
MNVKLKLFVDNLFSKIFDHLSCMIEHQILAQASSRAPKVVIYWQLLYHRNDASSIYRTVPSSYPLACYKDHPDSILIPQPAHQQQVNFFRAIRLF